MRILFLYCIECFSEFDLVKQYGEDTWFLTSLAAQFDQDKSGMRFNIQHLIKTNDIEKVVVLQSAACNALNAYSDNSQPKDYSDVVPFAKSDRQLNIAEENLKSQFAFVKEVVDELGLGVAVSGLLYKEGKSSTEISYRL